MKDLFARFWKALKEALEAKPQGPSRADRRASKRLAGRKRADGRWWGGAELRGLARRDREIEREAVRK